MLCRCLNANILKIINDNNADVLCIDSHYEFSSFFSGNKGEIDTLKNVYALYYPLNKFVDDF